MHAPLRYCYPKKHGTKVFQLLSVDDQKAVFQHRAILADQPESVHVDHQDLKFWKVTKSKMPMLCPLPMVQKQMPGMPAQQDFEKLQLGIALHHAYTAHEVKPEQISFAINPIGCYTLQPIKKKALKLIPLGTIAKVKTDAKVKVAIHHFGHVWAISPYPQDTKFQGDEKSGFIPFWWVQKSQEDAHSMQWSYVMQDGIKIPCLTNECPLEKNVELIVPKESGNDEGNADNSEHASQAKKKARKAK